LRQQYPRHKVDCVIEPNLVVNADPRLMKSLFGNLLGNAWKYTSRLTHARVEVTCTQATGGIVFSVRDNGAGFDMAHEQKLFKPFQRLHGAAEFEGTGVGLATVARIIDRHGGRIWAEGKPNAGAVFYFTLPTAPITDAFVVHHRALA
jgi:signal transduction histidine kinase